MRKNREGFLISEVERECTKCHNIFIITCKTVTLCKVCNSERVKSISRELKMINRARNRAKIKNIEFSLKTEDIIIPEYCPIMGIKLECGKGKSGGSKNSPSIDKIDPTKGYTKENIRIISHLANMMKSCATKDELITFGNWIKSEFTG